MRCRLRRYRDTRDRLDERIRPSTGPPAPRLRNRQHRHPEPAQPIGVKGVGSRPRSRPRQPSSMQSSTHSSRSTSITSICRCRTSGCGVRSTQQRRVTRNVPEVRVLRSRNHRGRYRDARDSQRPRGHADRGRTQPAPDDEIGARLPTSWSISRSSTTSTASAATMESRRSVR